MVAASISETLEVAVVVTWRIATAARGCFDSPTFAEHCATADEKLFDKIFFDK